MNLISKIEFGWVQNPNNFIKLKRTVSILNPRSKYHKKMVNNLDEYSSYTKSHTEHWKDIKHGLLQDPVMLSASQLIGRPQYEDGFTGTKNRPNQKPYGLVQVSAGTHYKKSRKNKKYWTDDWTSRGYVNWALTLDFWELDYTSHSDDPIVKLTKLGKDFSNAPNDPNINNPKKRKQVSIEEMILRKAIISYPPAVRILEILNANPNKLVSKFQLGSELGFVGEPGFTSFNEDDWINHLMSLPLKGSKTANWLKKHNYSNPYQGKFRNNAEGSADKWARTIASWLCKLNLVYKKIKTIPGISNKHKGVYIPQAYGITDEGNYSLRVAHGYADHSPQTKYISWQMLATKASNKDYVRIRRAYTIKFMQKYNDLKDIAIALKTRNLFTSYQVLKYDIRDLHFFGLYFEVTKNNDPTKFKIQFKDNLNNFRIPRMKKKQAITQPSLYKIITQCERKLTNLDAGAFQLIELAQYKASTRSKNTVSATLFENRVVHFMKTVMHLNGTHLGGPNKPDGALYYKNNFGIILDTKQYHKPYTLPISQRREMCDYITSDKLRNNVESNWYDNFPNNLSVNNTYYMWVSSQFAKTCKRQLFITHNQTGMNGAAMPIIPLLIIGNNVKGTPTKITHLPKLMQNQIITKSQAYNI